MAAEDSDLHPVWGELHSPWSSWMWEGNITVCFSRAASGWILMALMSTAYNQHHVVHCSNVCDPFWDLVDWLNAIADDRYPAKLNIDEEGQFTHLTVLPFDVNTLELRVYRPSCWVESSPGNWEEEPADAFERLILCRVSKYQLLAEFHRRLIDFLQRDFDPRCWYARDWREYVQENDRYSRYMDLRRLDLSRVGGWIERNRPRTMKIEKIVSGGQTGADRAALGWAIEHGVPHGGWCPTGRRAEDGAIHERYALREVPNGGGYRHRTKANVRDSDATLIVSIEAALTGGSQQTALFAQRLAKPWLHVHPAMDWRQALRAWLDATPIAVLNVAGPRASREAEVGTFTSAVLDELLSHIRSR